MLEDVKNYFANFDGATNICRTIALWITIVFVLAFVASKIYIAALGKRKKYGQDTLAATTKIMNGTWIIISLGIAVCFIIAFSACYFTDVANGKDTLVPILFYPLLVLILAAVGSGIALFVKPTKLIKIIAAAVCGGAFVAAIACMAAYYARGEAGEAFSNIGLYISAIAVTVGVVVFAMLADRSKRPFDTRTITFAAICIALSFALSYVRIFKMPMGGSITFASMLPLMLFAFMFGSRKGVLAGVIYGILQAIQDPWIIHPAQFLLDYAVAFAAIGLTGAVKDLGLFKGNMRAQFALGAVIACAIRFVNHYFAGVFAFGMYGADFAESYNMPILANPYFYSFVYQCMYLLPELAIVIAVSMLVFASKNFRYQISVYSDDAKTKTVPQPEPPVTEHASPETVPTADAATDKQPE